MAERHTGARHDQVGAASQLLRPLRPTPDLDTETACLHRHLGASGHFRVVFEDYYLRTLACQPVGSRPAREAVTDHQRAARDVHDVPPWARKSA
jgi:hypothetical protein